MKTMNRTSTVRARIEPELKEEVESLFHKLGLTTTEAISIFYNQVKLKKGLPFPVVIPSNETVQVFKDTDAGKELNTYKNLSEMFESLDKC